MNEEVVYIEDPLGRKIYLTKEFTCLEHTDNEVHFLYDDLYSVIQKPALLIETFNIPVELLYYRSIGWQFSVLIYVKLITINWEAYKCICNPSDKDIVELLKNGKQLI